MIKNKKPMLKETVGALYYAFNNQTEAGDYNPDSYEEEVVQSKIVKTIDTSENAGNEAVRASGEIYETVNDSEYIDMNVEVVAFDPTDLARMRADTIGSKLNRSGASKKRPFFAFGKVKKLYGGGVEYDWYPKCQLVENSDNISTKDENYSEQNDTITIRAYAYNKAGDKKTWLNSQMSNFPDGLTEEQFFSKPLLKDEDVDSVMNADNNQEDEQEGA